MKPPLKPGDIVEYTGRDKVTCVARVVQINDKGFLIRALIVDGKEYTQKNEIQVLNTQWETANFRIRLQLIK